MGPGEDAATVLSKAALVFGQMDEPPGVRLRVALGGVTMADHFRDVQNQDVLSSPTTSSGSCRPAPVWASSAVSPSAVGYQRTLADEMGTLERITSTRAVDHLAAGQVACPPGVHRPAPFPSFPRYDGTTELSDIAALGAHLPWIRWPRLDDPPAGRRRSSLQHRPSGQGAQQYKELQDIITILGLDELTEDNVTVDRARKVQRPLAADVRGRGLHRSARRVHLARRDHRLVRGASHR